MSKQCKYLKVCPRGFTNEIVYYRIPLDKFKEAEKYINAYTVIYFPDGGYVEWTSDKIASKPGVAINWDDRHW